MHAKNSPFPTVNSQGRLECKGTSTRDTEIAAGRVIFSSFYFSALCISLIGWRPSFSCRTSRCGF